jgi:hypothetical protein
LKRLGILLATTLYCPDRIAVVSVLFKDIPAFAAAASEAMLSSGQDLIATRSSPLTRKMPVKQARPRYGNPRIFE